MFLAIIALKNAGIVVSSPTTLLTLGKLHEPTCLLAILGFFIIVALAYRRLPGSIIIGVLGVAIIILLVVPTIILRRRRRMARAVA